MMAARIDYEAVLKQYPWIAERNQSAVLSPDSDGSLCGLLITNLLGWKVKGFYDGKIMCLEDGVRAEDCVFLDMEIFRPNVQASDSTC